MTAESPPITPADLTRAYAATGLIQFGRFEQPDGSFWPFVINLRWLPSYPPVLAQTAAPLVPIFEPFIDQHETLRLLTTAAALPIGVAVSLRTNIPLVYPYGEVHTFAIEGAYDVGHPTVLLADVLADAAQISAITAVARRVGLDVGAIVTVIDLGLGARAALEAAGYTVQALLTLRAMLPMLAETGSLLPVLRATVEEWLSHQGA